MRPGITLPIVDFLADLPATATNGSCFAMDRRAIGNNEYANIYVLVPTSASTATFWRLNVLAKTITQLTGPTLTANAIIGVGTAMIYDESTQRVWLFNSQSTTAAGYEWACWQNYNISTDTWTACNVASMALAAAWGTDAALCHPDARVSVGLPIGGQVQDDGFYLIGNAALRAYRYSIANNGWTALNGGGRVRDAVPGVGACLLWNAWDTNILYSFRGGGSTLVDQYLIQTDWWLAGAATAPAIAVTTGFEACSTSSMAERSFIAQNGQIYAYNHRTGAIYEVAHIDGVDGAAHTGKGFCYYVIGDKLYFALRPHSGTAVQRIRPII